MHSPYELGQGLPYAPHSSLLFENSSPISPSYRPQYPPSATSFPFFEPFSEPPTPAPPIPHHYQYNTPPVRRMDSGRSLPPMDWRLAPQQQQQPPLSSEWLLPDDKLEYNSGAVGVDEPLRSSFVFQHPSIPQGPSHEVSPLFTIDKPSRLIICTADQLSVVVASLIVTALSYICGPDHQIVGPTSKYLPPAKAQGRRPRRTCQDR